MEQNHANSLHKTIIFPDISSLVSFNQKTKNKFSTKKKLIFTGNMNCSPCVIRLKKIQEFLDKKNIDNRTIDFFYFGFGDYTEYFTYQIHENDFSYQIYGDLESKIISKNNLVGMEETTLLLDQNNKLLLIGDLLSNKEMSELFYNTMK